MSVSESVSILVVDDDDSNRGVLSALLTQAGYELHLAADGQSGMDAVADTAFDVAFLDIHLPDISGLHVIEAVRQVSDKTFIVAATIDDNPDTIHRAYAAGCDMFLVKPYNVSELIPLVQQADRGKRWIVDRFGKREYLG